MKEVDGERDAHGKAVALSPKLMEMLVILIRPRESLSEPSLPGFSAAFGRTNVTPAQYTLQTLQK